jgi:putative FmdB family regulatory protein
MPTYGYRCDGCGVEFEQFQRITEPPLTECPQCGGTVRRLLYPVGILFKGPGFHITDYRKSDKSGASSSSESKSEGSEATKKEEKIAGIV